MLSRMPYADCNGITLIELLLTLTIMAIVLALGVPATARWVRDIEVRSSAESLKSALQLARSEAVSRNTRVHIQLGNDTGHPGWLITCVYASTLCPSALNNHPPEVTSLIRWGAEVITNAGKTSTALKPGLNLPGGVDFYPLGDARQIAYGTDLARIDIIHARDSTARRLIIRIDGAGNIRLCDPALNAKNAEACH